VAQPITIRSGTPSSVTDLGGSKVPYSFQKYLIWKQKLNAKYHMTINQCDTPLQKKVINLLQVLFKSFCHLRNFK
jgi:hypothetical protein